MATLSKINVPTANAGSTRMDLSFDHITTQDFMQLQPVAYRHMIPGESIKVNANAFSRLAPMAVPTYGRARMNLRAFFVPFRTVFKHWTEFKEDTLASSNQATAIVNDSPQIQMQTFGLLFTTAVYGLATIVTSGVYDFKDGSTMYRLTSKGRRFMKILHSLGYRWVWDTKSTEPVSCLAILAYAKIYLDWYSLSAYLNTVDVSAIEQILSFNAPSSFYVMSVSDLYAILYLVNVVSYDGDIFTSAWDNPVAPNTGNFSSVTLMDVTAPQFPATTDTYIDTDTNGTPIMEQNAANKLGSQYIHTALKAVTDYMKRHQLSGARAIDRYLVDWGINLDAAKLNRSIYLGNTSIDVEIGDVMSHADTSTASLGDYAGRGFSNGNKEFEYQAEEFGIFMICSSILPYAGYWQGMDRNNLHLSKLDFYDKNFDNLGVQAMPKMELYVSNDSNFATVSQMKSTFGYVPRYAEYKRALSFVTGDIETKSGNIGGSSWHLMRTFDDNSFGTAGVANMKHQVSFCRGEDYAQYNRIFQNTDDEFDKFTVIYHFGISVQAPCKSLFDTYEFDNKGKELTLDANGTKMN